MTHHKARWSTKYRAIRNTIKYFEMALVNNDIPSLNEYYTDRITKWQDKLKQEYVRMTNEQNGFI